MVTPDAKRDAVVHAQKVFGMSERRACTVIGIARRVMRYVSRRSDDQPLRARLPALAAEWRRFGYRGSVGSFVLGRFHLVFEPFAEDDGELCFGFCPFTRRPLPVLRQVVELEV